MGTVLVSVDTGTGNDAFIVVEVDDALVREDQVVLASRDPAKAIIKLAETLQVSFDRTLGVVSEMLLRLRSLPNAPDQAEIQFRLKMGGEAGLIFARGSSEVNFQVTMSWQRPTPESAAKTEPEPRSGD